MEDFNGCPYSNVVALNDTLTILSGKWKLNIIRALLFRKYRFNELQKKIPHYSPYAVKGIKRTRIERGCKESCL